MKRVAFKNNPARMGYRELYRVAGGGATGLLICALKLVRVVGPDTGGFGMRSFGDTLDLRDVDDIPRRAEAALEEYRSKIEKLGFVPGFSYSMEAYGSQEGHGQVFRHRDGTGAAAALFCRQVRNGAETEMTVFGYNTPLKDDTYILTSGSKRLLNKPDTLRYAYFPGQPPKVVWERHLERVEQAEASPRKVQTDDDLARIVLYCENEETEFNLERGVFVRMTRSEVELGEELQDEYVHSERSGASGRRRKKDDDDDDDEDEDEEYDDDEDDDDNYRR